MFQVSYLFSTAHGHQQVKVKEFSSFASAMYYFLQKFHEERPGLLLSVVSEEALNFIPE